MVAPVPRASLNSRLSTAPTPARTPSQMVEDRKRGRVFN